MQQFVFIDANQRQRFTGCRRTASTANTVNIIFRNVWQLIVHDVRQLFDIEATRRDIRCHQNANVARFEIGQRTGTRPLALVAVDGCTANAIFIQLFRQVVGTVFGTGKDQHLLPVTFANHLGQQFPLTLLVDEVNVLGHLLRGGVATCHFDFQRITQQFFRQPFDLVGEGRGEQQVLTTCRQFRQHATNIVDKAHIQHTVRFIQHQDFNLIQFDRVLMFQIQQTARRGD
ncbi:hypothetical protein D3C72_1221740 [compost metagenome]